MISFFCLSRIGSDCGGSSSSDSGGGSSVSSSCGGSFNGGSGTSVSYGNCGGEQSQFQIIAVVDIQVLELRIQVAVVEGLEVHTATVVPLQQIILCLKEKFRTT